VTECDPQHRSGSPVLDGPRGLLMHVGNIVCVVYMFCLLMSEISQVFGKLIQYRIFLCFCYLTVV